jgi:hypothetical protein
MCVGMLSSLVDGNQCWHLKPLQLLVLCPHFPRSVLARFPSMMRNHLEKREETQYSSEAVFVLRQFEYNP